MTELLEMGWLKIRERNERVRKGGGERDGEGERGRERERFVPNGSGGWSSGNMDWWVVVLDGGWGSGWWKVWV